MTGIVNAVPVLLAVLIAALLPLGVLPPAVAAAFAEGGWGMRLILFALVVSLWLVADRVLMMLRSVSSGHRLLERLRPHLARGDAAAAGAVCAEVDRPLARIIGAGLAASAAGEHDVRVAMDAMAYRELPAIERRTGYLALMGNVATLMGLFGTIIGLIHSFGAVSMSSGAENATRLAAGISEAMNCTAFGLLTGILALVAYSALNGRTQALLDEINLCSLHAFRLWKRGWAASGGELATNADRGPIHAPAGKLMQSTGLLKGTRHGHGKKSTFASLQLTPLIDMFIVLVIFLLLSFSASGDIVAANKDIKPPFATNVQELERVPIVSISNMPDHPSKGLVTLEDREVALVGELTAPESGGDLRIARLSTQLERLRNAWNLRHADEPFDGKLIIQCDRDIDFRVIKRVMYSAGVAGYGNLMFAVRKKAEARAAP
ncbi:MAG: MotA/TolQ/ExbB proton channel family protein [Proteobacteria bacterium]|nr:MotA/TolQ/ExbB proton channel family protein [Pseudomonadota bacterium]